MGRRGREHAELRALRDEVWGEDYVPAVVGRPGRSRRFVRFVRFVRFSIVGASGILVNEAALAVFVSVFHVNYVVGALLATPCSTLWNFALLEVWAFKSSSHKNRRWQRWLMLMLVNNVANFATLPLLVLCTSVLGINYLISNFFTLVLVIVARFALADWIWAPARETEVPSFER
jgi:putative flippase GtrA